MVSIPIDCAIGPQTRPCATRVFLPSWSMPWRWFEIRIDMIMIGLDNISMDWFKGKFTGNHGFYH